MNLHNEDDVSKDIKWYNVKNLDVSEQQDLDKVAIYNNEIFLPIAAFNLTNSNIVAYMVETDSGEVLVTRTGKMFISGQTILDMAYIAHPDKVDELEECISRLFEKAMEAEIINYPVNEILL